MCTIVIGDGQLTEKFYEIVLWIPYITHERRAEESNEMQSTMSQWWGTMRIMNYNIRFHVKRNAMIGIMHANRVVESGMRVEVAVLHPGGSPRVTEGCAIVEVVV